MKNIVIVTDGQWRKSLAAVRALGQNKNNHIVVLGNSIFNMGLWSKYAVDKVVAPTAAKNFDKFGEKLLYEICKYNHKFKQNPTILPIEDETVEWMITNEALLTSCYFLAPDKQAFFLAQNKYDTMNFAKSLGIKTPCTKQFKNPFHLSGYIKKYTGEEFVVKPKTSKGAFGVIYINHDSPHDIIEKNWHKYGELILQDRIPAEGESICVSMLFSRECQLIAHFSHKRVYTYPISGGASTYRVSIKCPELLEKSYVLLKALKWRGIAMVEWKKDTRDNEFKLIEINPRFWGGLELAIKAGINFPQIYVDLTKGIKPIINNNYEIDVISRWVVPGEILRFLNMRKFDLFSIKQFLNGIVKNSDEWNRNDIKGSLGTIICQVIQVLNPTYWKYLKR